MNKNEQAGQGESPLPRWAVAALLLGILGVVVTAVYQVNVRPQAADIAATLGEQRSAVEDWTGAIDARERAVALWPTEPAHHLSLSWANLQLARTSTGDPLPWLERAEAELLAARDLRPGDHRVWAALGELYGEWGNRWDAEKLSLAHAAYEQATALAPHHAMLYTGWGLVELEGGHLAEAADRFRQAVDLDATDGFAFSYLGDVELAMGRVEEAQAAYQQAIHWEPGLSYAHLGLARCYWLLGKRLAAEMALDQALALDPGNAAALALRQQMEQEP